METHWADAIADQILKLGHKHLVASGITPSGDIHIGNMREVVTADAVYRALKDKNADVKLIYIADTFDPLRKVYPFLPDSYSEHIGKPLFKIPCPCGEHENYAEHFLQPFLQSLEALEINAEILRADEIYNEGKYTQAIINTLEQQHTIAQILEKTSHRKLPDDWSPFNPLCPRCDSITRTRVTGFNSKLQTVDMTCACGYTGTIPITGGGKLTWRVDWPARWSILGVTVEPFGKDHATSGGSYDTGRKIAKEIYHYTPPYPIVYEWIMLKGKGAMHSSKGLAISISEMLEVLPPEVLRYLIIRSKPEKHIEFDPGTTLLNLIDEYDRMDSSSRAYQLSQTKKAWHSKIPFKHIVTAIQVAGDTRALLDILERSGYDTTDTRAILARAENARKWLDKYAPPYVKFTIQERLPQTAKSFSTKERQALLKLAEQLLEWNTPEEIHNGIYEIAKSVTLDPKTLFCAIYVSLLSTTSGPRLGYFLASLDKDFLVQRFDQAAQEQKE